jgi:hypothetical protein
MAGDLQASDLSKAAAVFDTATGAEDERAKIARCAANIRARFTPEAIGAQLVSRRAADGSIVGVYAAGADMLLDEKSVPSLVEGIVALADGCYTRDMEKEQYSFLRRGSLQVPMLQEEIFKAFNDVAVNLLDNGYEARVVIRTQEIETASGQSVSKTGYALVVGAGPAALRKETGQKVDMVATTLAGPHTKIEYQRDRYDRTLRMTLGGQEVGMYGGSSAPGPGNPSLDDVYIPDPPLLASAPAAKAEPAEA